jgi:hypothetical protein
MVAARVGRHEVDPYVLNGVILPADVCCGRLDRPSTPVWLDGEPVAAARTTVAQHDAVE